MNQNTLEAMGFGGMGGGLGMGSSPVSAGKVNNYALNTTINAGAILSFTDYAGLKSALGPLIREVIRETPD